MKEIDERNLTHGAGDERAKSDKPLMRAEKIEGRFVVRSLCCSGGASDFAQEGIEPFLRLQTESMHDEIGSHSFTSREVSVRTAGEHMHLVASFAKLPAEVVSDPARSADGIREENVRQHEYSHQVAQPFVSIRQ
jgi:hypothetical protein